MAKLKEAYPTQFHHTFTPLDPTPKSERLWLCHLTGKATWGDLLQDAIAKLILGRDRSPKEVLLSLRSCGELDAVLAAGQFPDFRQDSSITPFSLRPAILPATESVSTRNSTN